MKKVISAVYVLDLEYLRLGAIILENKPDFFAFFPLLVVVDALIQDFGCTALPCARFFETEDFIRSVDVGSDGAIGVEFEHSLRESY